MEVFGKDFIPQLPFVLTTGWIQTVMILINSQEGQGLVEIRASARKAFRDPIKLFHTNSVIGTYRQTG
jgi:hypothetical protein